MKGFENQNYLIAYIISNICAVIILMAAIKKPKLARLMLSILFGWASWINYSTSQNNPEFYLEYADLALRVYSDFIMGWFSHHVTTMVTWIAVCQALISLGMLLKGISVKLACIGAIIFLLSISPLGVGSAFPFSVTVSFAIYFIMKRDDLNYIWKFAIQDSSKNDS